jgi:hypothetical protein
MGILLVKAVPAGDDNNFGYCCLFVPLLFRLSAGYAESETLNQNGLLCQR